MTLIVLVAFGIVLIVGVLGMLPGWWSRRHGRTPMPGPVPAPSEPSVPEPPHGV